jgi:hypothetical protein
MLCANPKHAERLAVGDRSPMSASRGAACMQGGGLGAAGAHGCVSRCDEVRWSVAAACVQTPNCT